MFLLSDCYSAVFGEKSKDVLISGMEACLNGRGSMKLELKSSVVSSAPPFS